MSIEPTGTSKPTSPERESFSAQETFDMVYAAMEKQGFKQSIEDGQCRYRSPEGLTCAVGCLLGDDYEEEFENCGINELRANWDYGEKVGSKTKTQEALSRLFRHDYTFLWTLQNDHHMATSPQNMQELMQLTAIKAGLCVK